MQQRRELNRAVGLSGSLRGMGQGATDPVWASLSEITVPTLVISGARDERYTDIATRVASAVPNATHAGVSGAGHCVHLEATASVLELLIPFIASVSG